MIKEFEKPLNLLKIYNKTQQDILFSHSKFLKNDSNKLLLSF